MGYVPSFFTTVLAISATVRTAASLPSLCPPTNGTFTINNHQLYPENADWDPVACKLYLSGLYNVTVLAYDPYSGESDILTFDGLTANKEYHLSAVDYDPFSQSFHFIADAGAAFTTSGANLAGPNNFIRYDPRQGEVVYIADLTGVQKHVLNATGIYPGGPQDVAVDTAGNSYVPFSFGTTAIAKVSPTGEVTPYYFSNETGSTASGSFIYGGIIYHQPTQKIVVANAAWGTFATFDTTAAVPSQARVNLSNMPSDYAGVGCDGLLNPVRYSYDVLLCSEDGLNAITAFASQDGWATAKYIGRVNNNVTSSTPVATVQISDSIFITEEFFADATSDSVGDRSEFPMVDITSELDALVLAEGIKIW